MRPATCVAGSVEPKFARDGGERFIKDVDAAHGFFLADDKRRVDTNDLRIRHRDEAALQRLVEQSSGDGLIERLLGRAIGNQFDADHQTASPYVSDKTVLLLQLFQSIEHQRSDSSRIFDQLFIKNDLDGAETCSSGKRVPAVAGRASARLSERFGGHAIEGRDDGTEGKTAADSLADSHDVGLEIELLGRPHRPRSAETGQDFICDEKSVEFICDFSHGVDKIVGRDDVARCAMHRLQDDCCNLALGVVFHDVAQMLRASKSAGWILKLPGTTITVGVRRQMHPRWKWTLVVAVAAAEKADSACGLAVVASPKSDKFEFFRHRLGKTEGSLDGLRAAREELDVRDAFGQQLADQIEKTCTGLGCEAAEGDTTELFVETFDVVRMRVADTADRDTGNEIQILIPIDVDDGAAFRVVHHDLRIEGDRLQARSHCFGLAIENRLGFWAGHDTALADVALGAVPWRRCDGMRSDVGHGSTPRRGHDARAPLEALGQKVRNRLCGAIPTSGIAWPGVDVDDHRYAVSLDDSVAAKNLEPRRGCCAECCPAQTQNLEGIAQHTLAAMIEPFEPIGVHRGHGISHAVEFDEIARHVLLGNNEGDPALGKSVQCLPPTF